MRIRDKASVWLAVFVMVFTVASGLVHPGKASASGEKVTTSGKWVNAATIEITELSFNKAQYDHIGKNEKDALGGLSQLNDILKSKALGDYKTEDVDPYFDGVLAGDGGLALKGDGGSYNRPYVSGGTTFSLKTGSSDNKSCYARIKAQHGHLQLVDVELAIVGISGCYEVLRPDDVDWAMEDSLTDSWKAAVYFNWSNSTTMKRVDGKGTFQLADSQNKPNRYYSSKSRSGCLDNVDLNPSDKLEIGFTVKEMTDSWKSHGGHDKGYIRVACNPLKGGFTYVGNTDAKKTPGSEAPSGVSPDSTTHSVTCESVGNSLSFIICPAINWLGGATEYMYTEVLSPWLKTKPLTDENKGTTSTLALSKTRSPLAFDAWSKLRIWGNIILIIAVLIIVFGQSIGGGMVDAYTAKKIMPRILISAILINLSFYIVAVLVDITNVVGGGISSLLTSISGGNTLSFSGGTTALLGTTLVGGAGLTIWASIVSAGAFAVSLVQAFLLFVLLPGFLAVLGVFVTLILRTGIILALIIVSPIAFALYCLPNTEQYFKKWWDLLIKALLVYPIVGLVFGISSLLAVTVNQAPIPGWTTWMAQLASIIILILPLFMVPFAFKMAGGLAGSIYGTLSGWNKRGSEAIKGNANDPNSLRNKTKRGLGEHGTRFQSNVARYNRMDTRNPFKKVAGKIADNPLLGNIDGRMAGYTQAAKERQAQLTNFGPDDLVYAGGGYELKAGDTDYLGNTVGTGEGETAPGFYNSKGKKISKGLYKRGKGLYGGSQADRAQALSYRLQKYQTEEDLAQLRFAFAKNHENDGSTDEELASDYAAITYPHKGMVASEWYSKPVKLSDGSIGFRDIKNDEGAYGEFIGDLHKTRESFRLGSLRDDDVRAMLDRQVTLQDKAKAGEALSDKEAQQLAQTYEVFDAMSQRSIQRQDGDDSAFVASGGTAASQPLIRAALDSRAAAGITMGVSRGADGNPDAAHRDISMRGRTIARANVTGGTSRETVSGLRALRPDPSDPKKSIPVNPYEHLPPPPPPSAPPPPTP